jgi:hypothetical protein
MDISYFFFFFFRVSFSFLTWAFCLSFSISMINSHLISFKERIENRRKNFSSILDFKGEVVFLVHFFTKTHVSNTHIYSCASFILWLILDLKSIDSVNFDILLYTFFEDSKTIMFLLGFLNFSRGENLINFYYCFFSLLWDNSIFIWVLIKI